MSDQVVDLADAIPHAPDYRGMSIEHQPAGLVLDARPSVRIVSVPAVGSPTLFQDEAEVGVTPCQRLRLRPDYGQSRR